MARIVKGVKLLAKLKDHPAVRDAVEHILKSQGRWGEAVRLFDPEHADAGGAR